MWTGEIREWYIKGGELIGRIYGSKNCRWANWEYPDGTFISIPVYHWHEHSKEDHSELRHDNYMHATLGKQWYWDLKQTHPWVPCPLNFKLLLDKEPDHWYLYQAGVLVCEYPWGRRIYGHDIVNSADDLYYCKTCKLMGSAEAFSRYDCEKDMSIIDDEEDPEVEKVIPVPNLRSISGGKDNTGNWLIGLKESSVFLCSVRKKQPKDDEDFILLQFHLKKKWNMGVWLHSNFPMQQSGDFLVHSLRFSQKHELVELLQDGDSEYELRRQDEEDRE